jgi:hypothetical protein
MLLMLNVAIFIRAARTMRPNDTYTSGEKAINHSNSPLRFRSASRHEYRDIRAEFCLRTPFRAGWNKTARVQATDFAKKMVGAAWIEHATPPV